MEKRKVRVITGWRQVAVARPAATRRFVPVPGVSAALRPPHAKPASPAEQRWESEGGSTPRRPPAKRT